MSEQQEVSCWYCPICNAEVTAPKWEEPEFFFWQVKKMGSARYNIEYAFCSKPHMMQYLKRKKEQSTVN